MSEPKFFLCKRCKNLVGMIHESGAKMTCCGEEMTELVPNTTDAAVEKHVPVVTVDNGAVTVAIGGVAHPMTPEHLIEWVYLQTAHGGQRKALNPGDEPKAVFALGDDTPIAAFAYCNLHGLWKASV